MRQQRSEGSQGQDPTLLPSSGPGEARTPSPRRTTEDWTLPQGRILSRNRQELETVLNQPGAGRQATLPVFDPESPTLPDTDLHRRTGTQEDVSAGLPPISQRPASNQRAKSPDRPAGPGSSARVSPETSAETSKTNMQLANMSGSTAMGQPSGQPGFTPGKGAAAEPSKPPPEQKFRTVRMLLTRDMPEFSILQVLSKTFGWPPPGAGKGDDEFVGNEIRTAKYTPISFLPVNLMEQFTRIANMYFLLIACIQAIPGLSPTSWFTTVLPLVFVLTINAVKEIVDDMARHRSDRDINGRMVKVRRDDDLIVNVAWRDLQVGDIVEVKCDQEIPCDLMFLKSADPEAICFVETANLDGETNLKIKYSVFPGAFPDTAKEYQDLAKDMIIRCEQPNEKLYVFEGYTETAQDGTRSALGPDNLLLRGSTLRKTSWVLGVAVFTGPDTKIMRNQTPAERKVTQLEHHMNVLVPTMFGILVTAAIILAGLEQVWLGKYDKIYWYLQRAPGSQWPDLAPGAAAYFVQVLRFIILLNQLIPISLYVTLEIVKVLQCNLQMNQDLRMYHEDTDTPFACRTTNLNEDLGQVQYVLSDKTGTLTQNVMGFVWSSIGGQLYGTNSIAADLLPAGIPSTTAHTLLHDPALHRDLGMAHQGASPTLALHDFLLCCAVANTVVPTVDAHKQWMFQASSPDEEALVVGAFHLGYQLVARASDHVQVMYGGELWFYDIMAILPFDSDRKRFSIVLRSRKDKSIKLFCKGADATVMPRIRLNEPIRPVVETHLDQMSANGYRTLCIAHRDLNPDEYSDWSSKYQQASLSLVDRDAKVAAVAEEIEQGLTLLGATAVEDKLQDGVPQAIEDLSQAGIQVWVLTGDKVETANSIAHSCRLYTDQMELIQLVHSEIEGGGALFPTPLEVIEEKTKEAKSLSKKHGVAGVGVTVEGAALAVVLAEDDTQNAFMDLCRACTAVVCCRVTPKQKAQVTNLVKAKANAIVLGIGDGANDVGMIKAAHIGVGISGREGRAAVLAADFSMAQFRFLTRLLLVHGRLNFKRNSTVVLYSFYKNWTYVLPYVYLSFYAGFSSQPLFTTMLISTYNVFWTSLPIIAYAVLEQDVNIEVAAATPQLYHETMNATRANFIFRWLQWMGQGTYHSAAVFFIPWYVMMTPDANGLVDELYAVGTTVFTAVIIVVNLKVALHTRYWTWFNWVAIFPISIGFWFLFLWILSMVWGCCKVQQAADMANIAGQLYGSPRYWLTALIAAPASAILLDITAMAIQRQFFYRDHHIYQEAESLSRLHSAPAQAT